ncbi:hypothetical protein WKV44_06320 [Spirochaetia bacterium 38H-sp]|uniref:Uncharacterized protein n=1 Tax=Rarispira pelagica TaxID=3141764 RepID=A0ABU9UDC7_9SPIR
MKIKQKHTERADRRRSALPPGGSTVCFSAYLPKAGFAAGVLLFIQNNLRQARSISFMLLFKAFYIRIQLTL